MFRMLEHFRNNILKYHVNFNSEYTVTYSRYLETTIFSSIFRYFSTETEHSAVQDTFSDL